jgi:hypothetical protein
MYIKAMSGYTSDKFPSMLGGGVPGAMPLGGLIGGGASGRGGGSGMEGGGERELERLFLRRVFGNRTFPNNAAVITPFRRYFNAGDTAGTVNSSPSPQMGNPINQARSSSMVSRLHASGGGTQSGSAFYTGNPKFVYDGSDFMRYRKLKAINKNYNDSSFGGSGGSTVAEALARVRR